ncbi:MAG TPA: HEAT repeat domain-containing protein [Candidatus Limnocylindrales bacterium]|jgi:HEAT repeat protein
MRPLDLRIEAALGTYDEDCRWDLIGGVLTECPDDVLETGTGLLRGELERERTLGADILGRLVGVEPNSRPVVLEALLAALVVEKIAAPLASIVAALGHIGDPGTLPRLLPLDEHHSAEVRLAVAFAVATISPQPLAPEARTALIRLSRDTDPEVRDWATFGLGTLSDVDGPDVRAALLARAEDAHHEARAEALFGLAVRRDPRAVPHLIRALQSPLVGGLEVDAAAAAADPRLLPALRSLQHAGLADEVRLRRAIDRCSGRDRPALVS